MCFWNKQEPPGFHSRNTLIHMGYNMYLYHRTLSQWEDELMKDKETDGVADLLTLFQQKQLNLL